MVRPLAEFYQLWCLPRGSYQRFNGKRSEHKVWAPKKVKGWKLYELVEAKGQVGFIGGRRQKGSFVVKDAQSGKALAEVTPSKLRRLRRPRQGWLVSIVALTYLRAKEDGASSPC